MCKVSIAYDIFALFTILRGRMSLRRPRRRRDDNTRRDLRDIGCEDGNWVQQVQDDDDEFSGSITRNVAQGYSRLFAFLQKRGTQLLDFQ
jgi:hypothetical protein